MSIQVSFGTYQNNETYNISPPQSPILEDDHLIKKSALKQPTIEDNSWNSPILHPQFFSGLNVVVSIENTRKKGLVESMLTVTGAQIVQEYQKEPEVIITGTLKKDDNKFTAILDLVKGKQQNKPKIVLPQQIPWALVKTQKLSDVDSISCPKIVLADLKNYSRPNFMIVKEYPKICFFATPSKDYILSPFVKMSSNYNPKLLFLSNCVNNRTNKCPLYDGPPNNGYCEICGVFFQNAKEHRSSPLHISKIMAPNTFAMLDALSKKFNLL